jgi:hypothetical protein
MKALQVSVLFFLAAFCATGQATPDTPGKGKNYANHSVLAQGQWYRIGVTQTGIHKITYQQMAAMGFTVPVESEKIRIFGNGGAMLPERAGSDVPDDLVQISIYVEDHGDGMLDQPDDHILFHAQGPVVWTFDTVNHNFTHQQHLYSDFICYFINVSGDAGLRVESVPAIFDSLSIPVHTSHEHLLHERDSLNLIKSGKLWFGEVFKEQLSYTFHFDLPDIVTPDTFRITTVLVARALDSNFFHINAWNSNSKLFIDKVAPNVNTDYARIGTSSIQAVALNENLSVTITYDPPDQNAMGWLNYIRVNARRALKFNGGQMAFRNYSTWRKGTAAYTVSGLQSHCRLWKVTDPARVKEIAFTPGGNDGVFQWNADTLHEFVAFDGQQFFTPAFIEPVINQDLHAAGFPDMVIVVHPEFRQEAERLAAFRRNNDGLDVLVLEPQTIYNEFSSGMQDPTAIRDFMRMLYVKADGDSTLAPRYLLLFGGGSYDMKDRISPNSNFIPTFQTWNSTTPTGSFMSDDYFGLLDEGEGLNAAGRLDIGIGRLPVITPAEAKIIVDKILRYNSPVDLLPASQNPLATQISNFGGWQNIITFIADDEDGNLHFKQAETLQRLVDSLTGVFNMEKIYLDAYPQVRNSSGTWYPDVNEALNRRVEKGALLINYTGHGGETGLAEEKILEVGDIEKWSNYYNMPVFITATCEFSRFDNPGHRPAGEYILFNPGGGSAAIFSTTRVAYAHSNMIINTNILKAALQTGVSHRLGDIMRLGKNMSGTGVYIQNFALLGDPAMKLAIPDLYVATLAINGDSISGAGDTVWAGELVSVTGCITDAEGLICQDFTGEVEIIIFDKPSLHFTLANDPPKSYVAPFTIQSDVLHKGRASVTGGHFTYSFTLPRDVSFREGKGKISYYAKSMDRTASGYYNQIIPSNSGNTSAGNGEGPGINLFLNNRGFSPGGITRRNPLFIADIYDEDGINFFGAGLGRDILAVFDDDFANPVSLNEYFIPTLDDSRQGTVLFPLVNLAEGPHKIWLRAWDVLNYSSEAELHFIVRTNQELSLNHVQAYPNPFSSSIAFCFDRNKTNIREWADINIWTVDGRLIHSMERTFSASDPTSACMYWDGNGINAAPVPQGIYIFTLTLTDATGSFLRKSGKVTKTR